MLSRGNCLNSPSGYSFAFYYFWRIQNNCKHPPSVPRLLGLRVLSVIHTNGPLKPLDTSGGGGGGGMLAGEEEGGGGCVFGGSWCVHMQVQRVWGNRKGKRRQRETLNSGSGWITLWFPPHRGAEVTDALWFSLFWSRITGPSVRSHSQLQTEVKQTLGVNSSGPWRCRRETESNRVPCSGVCINTGAAEPWKQCISKFGDLEFFQIYWRIKCFFMGWNRLSSLINHL